MKEWNRPAIRPDVPEDVVDVMYGYHAFPSKRAADTFPKESDVSDPDTRSTRSLLMRLLSEWSFINGTKASWEKVVDPESGLFAMRECESNIGITFRLRHILIVFHDFPSQ